MQGPQAPTVLWLDSMVRFLGFLPAACPATPLASDLEPCSLALLGHGLWSCPPGLADTAPWQGSWTDMPYAALQGQSGKGPSALAGLCSLPFLPAASSSLAPPAPPALAVAPFSALCQGRQALRGVFWLPLVSERIILSVDCPFL